MPSSQASLPQIPGLWFGSSPPLQQDGQSSWGPRFWPFDGPIQGWRCLIRLWCCGSFLVSTFQSNPFSRCKRYLNTELGINKHYHITAGSIHCFFEGYFVLNNTHIASNTDFFAQLWKEYSLSDSRYMTSDPFLLCIETWTVVCIQPFPNLPLSFFVLGRAAWDEKETSKFGEGSIQKTVLRIECSGSFPICTYSIHWRHLLLYFTPIIKPLSIISIRNIN